MDSETAQNQQTLEDQRRPQDQQAPNDQALKDQQALVAELGTSQESVDALGELGKLGGAQLFWGSSEAVATGEDQLGRVRERVIAFESRVGELEARRQSTREQIDKEQYRVELIEGELFEAH